MVVSDAGEVIENVAGGDFFTQVVTTRRGDFGNSNLFQN